MRPSSQDTLLRSSTSPLLLPEAVTNHLSSSNASVISNSSTHSISSFRKTSKRPRQQTVRFSETATLHVVSNHRQELSREELHQVYYSRRELETIRRKSRQLAETFAFYSEEDLMDRFGLPSIARQVQRLREIRQVWQCVTELEYEDSVECLTDDTFMTIISLVKEGDDGRQEAPTGMSDDLHDLVEDYHILTRQSTQLAKERANRIHDQVAAAQPERRSH